MLVPIDAVLESNSCCRAVAVMIDDNYWDCYLKIVLRTNRVCGQTAAPPGGQNGGVSEEEEDIGMILCVVFFVAVFVYIGGGMAYNIKVGGAKGQVQTTLEDSRTVLLDNRSKAWTSTKPCLTRNFGSQCLGLFLTALSLPRTMSRHLSRNIEEVAATLNCRRPLLIPIVGLHVRAGLFLLPPPPPTKFTHSKI